MKAAFYLKKIKVELIIGANSKERLKKQPLEISVQYTTDCKGTFHQDALSKVVNYSTLVDFIKSTAEQTNFELLESFCEYLYEQIKQNFAVSDLQLSVHKPFATSGKAQVYIQYPASS